jgi:hypothetical protein
MRSVMGRNGLFLHRPPLTIEKILNMEARKERDHLLCPSLMVCVCNDWAKTGTVCRDIVLDSPRKIDDHANVPKRSQRVGQSHRQARLEGD